MARPPFELDRESTGASKGDSIDALRFELRCAWDGSPLRADESASIELEVRPQEVTLRIEAAFHGDPAPPAPPGRLDGLWDFEVVEVFLLGADERYLELEFGPHGHWLGLRLAGRRCIIDDRVPIDFETRFTPSGWTGHARLGPEALPEGLTAANGYAIHGAGPARRHLAMYPVPGPTPDFHRLECFGPLEGLRADRAPPAPTGR